MLALMKFHEIKDDGAQIFLRFHEIQDDLGEEVGEATRNIPKFPHDIMMQTLA